MKSGPKPRGQVSIHWSAEFAYAIGLITADGCLLNDGRHIDFTSKDLEQVRTFKDCLGLRSKIGTKLSGFGNQCYRVQFGDVLFYSFLESIGLQSAKSRTLSSVKIPARYFPDFLRGYYDGDGTSYSFYDSKFPESYRFYLAFTSASSEFIIWLREKISDAVSAEGHVCEYTKKNYFQLKYAKQEAIRVCRCMYYDKGVPFLGRKYLKIQQSLDIINERRGGEIGKHATFRT